MSRTALFSRKDPGGVYTIEDIRQGTGQYFFVSSVTGATTNSGLTPDSPLTTWDAGVNKCTASSGDTVVLMENHAEDLDAASAVDLDVVGVRTIGLGRGTDRPQISFSETDATITAAAANCSVENVHFINAVDALVVGIPVTAAHFLVKNCLFDDATAAKQTNDWITLSAAADYFECVDCEHHGSDTAGAQSFISGAAADHVKVIHLQSHGDMEKANIEMTAAWTDCLIDNCILENANAVDVNIEGFAAATGQVRYCSLEIATDAQTTAINTGGTLALFENYFVNNDAETGKVQGTASA